MKTKVKHIILLLIDLLFPEFIFKIRKNRIVASSFRGRGYSGNPAIVLNQLRQLQDIEDLDLYWIGLKGTEDTVPKGVHFVRYNSLQSYWILATSTIWIDDFRKKYAPRKRVGQWYFQLWHGVLPLKKIEKDATGVLDSVYLSEAKRDGKISDFMVSGNRFNTNIYKNKFWFDGEVLEFGTPELDDVIAQSDEEDTKQLFMSGRKKTVLYAPTFREHFDAQIFSLWSKELETILEQSFGGSWQGMIRLHPNMRSHVEEVLAVNPGAKLADDNISLSEALLKADIVITDYSSVMFNAMYANKLTILFVKDEGNYLTSERGTYFSLDELPFLKVNEAAELRRIIASFNLDEYLLGVNEFKARIGDKESGVSAEKVAQVILQKIKG
ncbi:MAG: CDP-glycerol glycerophosphotransferase family protein [Weissella confusa]|nr:CDP-glycerol glycerophosphotransferase family protein [Weissella confusa]